MSAPQCSRCGREITSTFVLSAPKRLPGLDVCQRCRVVGAKERKRKEAELARRER